MMTNSPEPPIDRFYCPKCRLILEPSQVIRWAHTIYELRGAVAWPVTHAVVPFVAEPVQA